MDKLNAVAGPEKRALFEPFAVLEAEFGCVFAIMNCSGIMITEQTQSCGGGDGAHRFGRGMAVADQVAETDHALNSRGVNSLKNRRETIRTGMHIGDERCTFLEHEMNGY